MKYFFIFIVFILTACTSKTEFGRCVGIWDEQEPTLIYKPSVRNLFWGIVGLEIIYPPLDVAINKFYCPVGRAP